MGYYMRFISTDNRNLDLDQIEGGLRSSNPVYSIVDRQTDRIVGSLMHGSEVCAQIEINGPDGALFRDEIEELKEFAEEAGGRGLKKVLACLDGAKQIVAVQVLFREENPDATLEDLGPLWEWLFKNREGLLQADGEGYYNNKAKLIFAEE